MKGASNTAKRYLVQTLWVGAFYAIVGPLPEGLLTFLDQFRRTASNDVPLSWSPVVETYFLQVPAWFMASTVIALISISGSVVVSLIAGVILPPVMYLVLTPLVTVALDPSRADSVNDPYLLAAYQVFYIPIASALTTLLAFAFRLLPLRRLRSANVASS